MGHSIGHIWGHLQENAKNVIAYHEKMTADRMPHGDPGVITTHKRKVDYANALRDAVISGALRIYEDLVVANDMIPGLSRESIFERTWEKLQQQMRRYRVIELEGPNPSSRRKVVVSGVVDKTGQKNPAEQDDLMFTLTFCLGISQQIHAKQLPNFDYRIFKATN